MQSAHHLLLNPRQRHLFPQAFHLSRVGPRALPPFLLDFGAAPSAQPARLTARGGIQVPFGMPRFEEDEALIPFGASAVLLREREARLEGRSVRGEGFDLGFPVRELALEADVSRPPRVQFDEPSRIPLVGGGANSADRLPRCRRGLFSPLPFAPRPPFPLVPLRFDLLAPLDFSSEAFLEFRQAPAHGGEFGVLAGGGGSVRSRHGFKFGLERR